MIDDKTETSDLTHKEENQQDSDSQTDENTKSGSVSGFEKAMWVAIAGFSIFWIFFPEPTDAVPFLGWLDEVTAGVVLLTALNKLGVNIPILTKLFAKKWGIDDKPPEKDVTPK